MNLFIDQMRLFQKAKFYLSITITYFFLKLRWNKIPKRIHIWYLDFYVFCRYNSLEIKSINRVEFRIVSKGHEKNSYYIRHYPSSDFDIFKAVIIQEQYAFPISFSNENPVIIDAGANVGFTSMYFSSKFPKATIIAIEPEKENFIQLKKNIGKNNLKNVILFEKALWHESTTLSISSEFRDKRSHSFRTIECTEKTSENNTSTITILDLFNKYSFQQIDLLKMDIEGAEAYIFSSHDFQLLELPKVNQVILEIHDEVASRQEIENILHNQFNSVTDEGELTWAYGRK